DVTPDVRDPRLAVIPVRTVPGTYPVAVDSAAVVVGRADAKVHVDIYEDYLCPVCARFDAQFGDAIDRQVAANAVQVSYYPVNLLDHESTPAGYSMLSANAAVAVAIVAPATFLDFQRSLFGKQPAEGGAGWTRDELLNLAYRLGVSGSRFDSLVSGKAFDQQIQANLDHANSDPGLEQDAGGSKAFGTPAVFSGGHLVDWSGNPNWLTDLVGSAH
ncbi:MAG TPA: thioredoxin domain-containing protein, partial [Pseudonocardiaceae bacterium]|nr:thioredoxin domain-containing protein [Pseudonocardiaceae bacterium]